MYHKNCIFSSLNNCFSENHLIISQNSLIGYSKLKKNSSNGYQVHLTLFHLFKIIYLNQTYTIYACHLYGFNLSMQTLLKTISSTYSPYSVFKIVKIDVFKLCGGKNPV